MGRGGKGHEVLQDDTPIDLYEADILDRAQRAQPLTFEAIFAGRANRSELMALFLALLELIRQRLVRIEQEKVFGPIYIFALTDEPAELAVAHAVSADIDRLPGDSRRRRKRSDISETAAKPAPGQPPAPADGPEDGQLPQGIDPDEQTRSETE